MNHQKRKETNKNEKHKELARDQYPLKICNKKNSKKTHLNFQKPKKSLEKQKTKKKTLKVLKNDFKLLLNGTFSWERSHMQVSWLTMIIIGYHGYNDKKLSF